MQPLFEKKGDVLGVAPGGSNVTAQARNFPKKLMASSWGFRIMAGAIWDFGVVANNLTKLNSSHSSIAHTHLRMKLLPRCGERGEQL